MILVQAVKLATAQRRIVRKVAQYKKGDAFNIDDKIKLLNITINDAVPNKDTYKCVPKRLSDFAKKIADATGEFSRNPIKKIVSWVKCYVQNVKDLFKTSQMATKEAEVVSETAAKPAPKPETIKFSKEDAVPDVAPKAPEKPAANPEVTK